MSNPENIEKYLKIYVKSFVKNFEEQLKEYKEEIDVRKGKPKEGKTAGLVNSAIGVLSKPIPLVNPTAPIQNAVSSVGSNKHKNKAKTVIGMFNNVKDNVFKKSLVTAGGNIFKKIEGSLVKAIENEKNYERSIEKIAHDTVDRAMSHLYSHPLENTENLSDKIVNAVFSGDSKRNLFKWKKNPFRKGSKIGTTTSNNLFQTSDKEVGFLQGKSEKEFELMLLSIFLEEIDKSDESIKMQNEYNIFIKGFKDKNGQNILHSAIEKDNIEMVIYILKSNQSQDLINAQDNRGATPLHYAAKSGNLEIVKLVESRDLDLNAQDNRGATPLHYAAESGNLEIVKWLVESRDLDLNAQDNRGATPLHYAAESGNLEIVKWLVESRDLDLNAQDNRGATPLHYAAESGNLEIVKWLVESRDLDLNAQDNNKLNPLHYAAKSGNLETVKWLVESRDLDLNAQDNNKLNPIHHAAKSGNLEIVKWLAEVDTNFDRTKARQLKRICVKILLNNNSCLTNSDDHLVDNKNYGYIIGFLSPIIKRESEENNIQENMRPILGRGVNHSDRIKSGRTSSKLDPSPGK